jgi:hypothetical protein
VSDNDTNLYSAAISLVAASDKEKTVSANKPINIIDDNKKDPIDVISLIIKNLSDTAEKNSEALINSNYITLDKVINNNYNALDKVINNKLTPAPLETKSVSTANKSESIRDKVSTVITSTESLPTQVKDNTPPYKLVETLKESSTTKQATDTSTESLPNKLIDILKQSISTKLTISKPTEALPNKPVESLPNKLIDILKQSIFNKLGVTKPTEALPNKPVESLPNKLIDILKQSMFAKLGVTKPTEALPNKPVESLPNKLIDILKQSMFAKLGVTKPADNQYPTSSSSNETQYYTRIFTILGKVLGIGKFTEGPEAGRLQSSSIQSELIQPKIKEVIKDSITLPKTDKTDKKDEEDGSILNKIKKLGVGVLVATLLADILTGDFAPIAQGAYQGVKTAVQATIQAASKFKNYLGNLTPTTTPVASSAAAAAGVKPAITTTSVASAASTAAGVKPAITTTPAVTSTPGPVMSKLKSALNRASTITDNVLNSGKRAVQSVGQATQTYVVQPVKAAGRAIQTAVVEPVKAVGQAAIDAAFNGLRNTLGRSGGTLKFLSTLGRGIKSVAPKLPIVGPLLEIYFAKGDIEAYKQERTENKITDQELYKKSGDRLITGIGGLLGSGIGGTLGAALSGPLAPFGAFLGALGGYHVGRYAAKIASTIIPDSAISGVGQAIVTGTLLPAGDTGEMQDFIIKNNQVYKFSNKDEILGMKDGGAVKQLLSSNSQNNDKQLFISNKQVLILEQIRDGIIALTNTGNKNNNRMTNINTNNTSNQKSLPSSMFLRSDFNVAHNLKSI